MAYNSIVKDATSYKQPGDVTSTSWNHTVGTGGTDTILVVILCNRGGNADPSTVKFNNKSLTKYTRHIVHMISIYIKFLPLTQTRLFYKPQILFPILLRLLRLHLEG